MILHKNRKSLRRSWIHVGYAAGAVCNSSSNMRGCHDAFNRPDLVQTECSSSSLCNCKNRLNCGLFFFRGFYVFPPQTRFAKTASTTSRVSPLHGSVLPALILTFTGTHRTFDSFPFDQGGSALNCLVSCSGSRILPLHWCHSSLFENVQGAERRSAMCSLQDALGEATFLGGCVGGCVG